jgi:3-deoxy-D-manno-octulosonic-acid transferase
MVNGRVSQKSVDFWERYPQLRKRVVESFTLCMVQSEADKARMLHMGAAQVKILGNLKYDAPPLPAAKEAVAQMQEMIAGRPVWIAASTHEGEEEAAAEAHIRLKKRYPQLLTVIVPRHPARLEAITLQLEKKGLKMAIRSKNEPLIADTDIYIADTMGELGLFFRVSKIVFIGASLVPKGGHNPLEPARMGCAIIMGPFVYNCVDICQHLQNKGALIQIENAAKLYDALALLFGDTARQEEMSARALEVVEDTNAITENYITAIKPFLRTIRGVMRA